jgi:hypothetical protein
MKEAGAFFFFGLSAEIFGAIILLSRSALAVGLVRVTGRQDFEWLQGAPEEKTLKSPTHKRSRNARPNIALGRVSSWRIEAAAKSAGASI